MDFGRAARDASRNRAAVKDGVRTTDGTNAQAHCADGRNGKAKGGAQLRPRLVRSTLQASIARLAELRREL
jgi:hypothetical protein